MSEVKTAYIPPQVWRAGKTLRQLARQIRPGVQQLLWGAGELPEGMRPLVGRYGGLDFDLLRARDIRKQLESAGWAGDLPFEKGIDDVDIDKLRDVEEALPTLWGSIKGFELPEMEAGLRGAGIDLTPEQVEQLARQHSPVRATLKSLKNLYLGEAPLETSYQRFLQGGLFGPGGVLLGEAAPGGHLARRYGRAKELLDEKKYWEAFKAAPKAGTLGYLSNVGFGYGFPMYLGYEAYRGAEQEGQNPLAALGASATTALGGAAMSPLGIAQMHLFGPLERLSQKAWGITPPQVPAPRPAPPAPQEMEPMRKQRSAMPVVRAANAVQRRLQRAPGQSTGYQTALHNSMLPGTY